MFGDIYGKETTEKLARQLSEKIPERVRDRACRTWRVMSEAWVQGEILSIREISLKTHWSRSSVDRQLDNLEMAGIIHRPGGFGSPRNYRIIWLAFGVKKPAPVDPAE